VGPDALDYASGRGGDLGDLEAIRDWSKSGSRSRSKSRSRSRSRSKSRSKSKSRE
jgi:hypothetical protein